ncbi:5-formyltetrahydrofolate cyclo-ligase [Lachnospiraceae bacterium LCP25S3_G4]
MEKKQEIRKACLLQRKALSLQDWKVKSDIIIDKVLSHPLYLDAEYILCYIDAKQEVCTKRLIEKSLRLGKKVAVPRVSGSEMAFYYIQSYRELEPGYFGILEPNKHTPIASPPHALVIMPGVAFDFNCNRIGYGKGFYDKYLVKHENYRRMALAFDIQCVEHVEADEFDIRPELVVTEGYIYEEELFTGRWL